MIRRRLDLELVRRGLAPSTAEAQRAVEAGAVTVSGRPATKPTTLVASDEPIAVAGPGRRFASRGGEKLVAALDRFGIDVAGRRCLDAGASTGGFTDVLVSSGAAVVVAVDVGYGQLDWSLRSDPRVVAMERVNVRHLTADRLPFRPDLVVADLSFISLSKVVPTLAELAAPGADLVLLVKPQFEAARGEVGEGGVVGDPLVWRRSIERVATACRRSGLGVRDVMASPLTGPAGNVEFLLHARHGAEDAEIDLDRAVDEAPSRTRKTG